MKWSCVKRKSINKYEKRHSPSEPNHLCEWTKQQSIPVPLYIIITKKYTLTEHGVDSILKIRYDDKLQLLHSRVVPFYLSCFGFHHSKMDVCSRPRTNWFCLGCKCFSFVTVWFLSSYRYRNEKSSKQTGGKQKKTELPGKFGESDISPIYQIQPGHPETPNKTPTFLTFLFAN